MRRIVLLGAVAAALSYAMIHPAHASAAACTNSNFYYAGARVNVPLPGQDEGIWEGIAPGYQTYGYVWPTSYGHIIAHLYAIVPGPKSIEVGLYNGAIGDGSGGIISSTGISTFSATTTDGVHYTNLDGPDVVAGTLYKFRLHRSTGSGTTWTSYYGTTLLQSVNLGSNTGLAVGAETEDAVLNGGPGACDTIDGMFDNSDNLETSAYCTLSGGQCGWNSLCSFSVHGTSGYHGWESYWHTVTPWWGCTSTFNCPPICSLAATGEPTYPGTWSGPKRLPKSSLPPPLPPGNGGLLK